MRVRPYRPEAFQTGASVLVMGVVAALALGGCSGSSGSSRATPAASDSTTSTSTASTGTSPTAPLSSVVTTTTTGAPAAFSSTVDPVTGTDLGASYRDGCPVGPSDLRTLHLGYWGFDDQPHTGAMVVAASVVDDVVAVFHRLYDERFPIRQMKTLDTFDGSDPASMAADNTSGFNCRYAVAAGPPQWSAHAFGTAIDVNTVENPYLEGGEVQPPAGVAYTDRATYRPGMAVADGQLVQAFAAVGWQWGGRWEGTPDYQHFSRDGN